MSLSPRRRGLTVDRYVSVGAKTDPTHRGKGERAATPTPPQWGIESPTIRVNGGELWPGYRTTAEHRKAFVWDCRCLGVLFWVNTDVLLWANNASFGGGRVFIIY